MISPAHLWERLSQPDSIFRFEYREKNTERYKTLSCSPIQWEHGRAKKILLIAQDTTEEKLSEIRTHDALRDACQTANRANQAKTEFLSNMSHDIRTPMNAIVGMTAIAGAHINDKERVRDCLGKITQVSHHLLELINEVLDMARIENGKISLNEEEFCLILWTISSPSAARGSRSTDTGSICTFRKSHTKKCGATACASGSSS